MKLGGKIIINVSFELDISNFETSDLSDWKTGL